MKQNPTLLMLVIIGVVFLITYALADGIRYGSVTGVVMSIISLFALTSSIHLYQKLVKLKKEEENDY